MMFCSCLIVLRAVHLMKPSLVDSLISWSCLSLLQLPPRPICCPRSCARLQANNGFGTRQYWRPSLQHRCVTLSHARQYGARVAPSSGAKEPYSFRRGGPYYRPLVVVARARLFASARRHGVHMGLAGGAVTTPSAAALVAAPSVVLGLHTSGEQSTGIPRFRCLGSRIGQESILEDSG